MLSVRPSVNTHFAWRSLRTRAISMKLVTNIHVTEYCGRGFQAQKSKLKVVTRPNAILARFGGVSSTLITMVTSDFRPEVEIWPFRACAMHPAIIIGRAVRSLWTWLWGRYHVPQNVFILVSSAKHFEFVFVLIVQRGDWHVYTLTELSA